MSLARTPPLSLGVGVAFDTEVPVASSGTALASASWEVDRESGICQFCCKVKHCLLTESAPDVDLAEALMPVVIPRLFSADPTHHLG